ncbi:MFS transporter [Nonomuraea polychroma]|uniref:MFS transporter n=1 Tax=Nonomuraea polychroma TaxID=46176 RepID=A0A438MP53_9ACTN|nr:MFS transporter [Nonomuraea polychroma]RVX47674.1 MFS transporter [Nonomuraea polychroma]
MGERQRESIPADARTLLWIRVLNQLGSYALAFLAVLTGPELAPAALASFGIAALVSRWAGAFLLDRLPPRTVLALGLGLTGLSLLVLAAARTPPYVLGAVVLVGLAFELYEPATQEFLARAATGARRQHVYALLGVSLSAAGAVAGLLAAVLLPLGVRWLVIADAVTCLAAAGIAVRFLPRGEERAAGAATRRRWRPPLPLLRLTLAGTVFAVGSLAVMMFLPLALLERGAPAWAPGLTLAGAALLGPLALWATGRHLESRGHGIVLGGGVVLLGLLALAMAISDQVWLTAAAYLGSTAANGLLLGRWQALVADAAPEPDRPRWFAFHGSSWGIAQPVVPGLVAVFGSIAGSTGAGAFWTAALAFLAVPLFLSYP